TPRMSLPSGPRRTEPRSEEPGAMSIPTVCPHCGTSFVLNDALLGKKVRCKSCQQPFVVEHTEEAETVAEDRIQAAPARKGGPRYRADDDDPDTKRPPKKGGKKPAKK